MEGCSRVVNKTLAVERCTRGHLPNGGAKQEIDCYGANNAKNAS